MPQPLNLTPSESAEHTDSLIAARKKAIGALETELKDIQALIANAELMADPGIARATLDSEEMLERQIRVQHFLLAEAEARKKTLDDVANGKRAGRK